MSLRLAFCLLAVRAAHPSETAAQTTYVFKQVADCSIRADVYRPRDQTIRPVVFWIHGGALIFGSRENLRTAQLQRYLEAGFAVVSIDYRLAPETKLPEILDDVRDAHDWVRTKGPDLFHIDPDRIAVVGHSAGGYLTLTCGHRLSPAPKALVSFYGYGDIKGEWYSRPDPFYSTSEKPVSKEEAYGLVGRKALSEALWEENRFRFYLYCRQRGLWPREVTGHDPDTDSAAFKPWCPLLNVGPGYPPTMLLHGDKDTDVPFAQSEQMARELKARGVRHEFIAIPGGEHGFDARMQDPVVARAFDRVIDFLKSTARK